MKIIGKLTLPVLILLHLLSISLIIYIWKPIADWYINFRPLFGVDFHLLVTITQLLKQNFVAPFALWNYSGFGGWPAFIYPPLHGYIAYFFSNFFDLVYSIQIWMMVSAALFIIGAYFLFFAISRNFLLSIFLSIAVGFSGGVYQTLTWAGSLPSYGTQAALPWSLMFLVLYLKSFKPYYLLSSVLIAGISILGHPLIFVVYILPAVSILIFANLSGGWRIFSKIKQWLFFLLVSLLIGLPLFYSTFEGSLQAAIQTDTERISLSTTTAADKEYQQIQQTFSRAQVQRVVTDNHLLPFIMAATLGLVFVLSLIISRNLKSMLTVLPYVLITAYFFLYVWLFGEGISIYHGGWYRLFWSVPIWIGMLAAVFWRASVDNLNTFFKTKTLRLATILVLNLVVIYVGAIHLVSYPINLTLSNLIYRGQVTSAHPDILNLRISEVDREKLKERLVPAWLDGESSNFRFYEGDQTVNIWWPSMFKMPLARGYIDPPINASQRGYIFWLDSALSESEGEPQLVKSFKYPLETTISNALFLVDWNAIRYFEGGHIGNVYTPVPKYLQELLVNKTETLDFNDEKYTNRPVTLNYYEFKPEVTSPVMAATNVPTMGVFASDQGYETVIRLIAEKDNLNSQVLIPIKLGRSLDKIDLTTLQNFDALYLYDYEVGDGEAVFRRLKQYVTDGKKVFIDTGVEVKQSSGELPDFFPIKKVQRRGMGKEWKLDASNHPFNQEIDFQKFSAPIFDESEWKLSYGEEKELRSGAQIILKNKNQVVMATYAVGSGKVIWSGLNFAYHVTRNHNQEEAKFAKNIFSGMLDLSKKPPIPFQVNFKNPNLRLIEGENAKGVLFKEQAYDGWRAWYETPSGKRGELKIFKAGPTFPGYMYVFLPSKDKMEVKFSFSGSLEHKVIITLSGLLILLLLELILLRGIISGKVKNYTWNKLQKRTQKWWEKEEED